MVPPRRRFHKTPPARIKNRWPGDWDWQYLPIRELPLKTVPCLPWGKEKKFNTPTKTLHENIPGNGQVQPTFMLIAHLVQASNYLDETDYNVLTLVTPALAKNSLLLEFPFSRPWKTTRKRQWGFGKVHKDRYSTHAKVNPRSMIHYAWGFLSTVDRHNVIIALPQWRQFASLRRFASVTSLACLKEPRVLPTTGIPTRLDPTRAKLNSAGLLRFDFLHGDFIRWLGGEYVNSDRDFNAEWDVIDSTLHNKEVPAEYPPLKLEMAYRIQTEGVPIKAQYTTPMSATVLREEYDNHPAVAANSSKVEEKFAKEEWKAYHIHYLRFVFQFIPGLVINPIQWVFDKGKGRICIDCSNGPDDLGSINTYIPKPKQDKSGEQCPPIHYQFAFKRFLRQVLRMRITKPTSPILVHADDIEAAFRRVLYHPDVAVAFAYVYSDYLIVPVGQVFGSRNAPSFYCVLADLREVLATCRVDVPLDKLHALVRKCTIAVDTSTPLCTVPADSHHPPLSVTELVRMYNASYVDDNAVAAFAEHIKQAINHSVMSAFEVFGHGDKRRGDCLQDKKWEPEVTETFLFLGFRINTHNMTVSWPLYKREDLHSQLLDILKRRPRCVSPREMAKIVGIVRSASEIAPWGNFLSFNLQNALTQAAKNAFSDKRSWWTCSRIYLSRVAVATIHQLLETLLAPEDSPLWSRPIALYLDRDYTHRAYSDASYGGLGGWSADFSFLWRLTRDTLVEAGFEMREIKISSNDPALPDGFLHINPLEYLGALINLWICIKCVILLGPIDGGYILALLIDNTTAVSWMSTASRTKDPLLQGLARIGSALLVEASQLLMKVCPKHHPGNQNGAADALSRPQLQGKDHENSLASVIAEWSQLQTCRICLLPFELLSKIALTLKEPPTGDQQELSEHDLQKLDDAGCILVLGTYLRDVKRGDNSKEKEDLKADTLRNYLSTAHKYLQYRLGRPIQVMDPAYGGKQNRYHPFLFQQIHDRRCWQQKNERYEPFTMEMFVALQQWLANSPDPTATFLGKVHCVYDWTRLGIFTGFRASEYSQGDLDRGKLFNTIPHKNDVPKAFRGMPLAMMAIDFRFFDKDYVLIPHHHLVTRYNRGDVVWLELCWRYDKSAFNFVKKRFKITGHPIYCPVDAAVCIIRRKTMLGVPGTCPIGVWSSGTMSSYHFLKSREVSEVMRRSVDLAYPNPNHYMRINRHLIVPHSNRVTAAVCLQKGGANNDEIAFRLRWLPSSVPTYLRDCFQSIGDTLERTIQGAMKLTFSSSSSPSS